MRIVTKTLFTTACIAVASVCSARAANYARVDTTGKVVGVKGMDIYLRTTDGKQLIASVDPIRMDNNIQIQGIPAPKVEVTGNESAKSLRPGTYVRFEAKVVGTRRKSVKEPVKLLTAFVPTPQTRLGLSPNEWGGEGFGDGAGGPAGANAGPGDYLISGQITAIRSGTMTVSFPGGSVRARLAADAVVTISANDHRLARPGDDIHLKGALVRPTRVFATEVTITRAQAPQRNPKLGRRPKPGVDPPKVGVDPPKPGVDPPKVGVDPPKPGVDPPKVADGGEQKPFVLEPGPPAAAGDGEVEGRILKVN